VHPKVDVWLAGQTAGELTPPPWSIIDGGQATSVVRTRCLGRYGLSRLVVHLPVDAATARRFALTCRMETMWRRRAFPVVLVAAIVIVIAHVADSVRNDAQHLGTTLLVSLILAFTTLTGRLALNLVRSPHHPREVGGDVYVRGVDGATAEIWTSQNPLGSIRIMGG
jgi:hypothetical protein